MRWNYANFDKWVSFMINEVGVKGQISCYTMINITRLWTGAEQPADHLRYGQGHGLSLIHI